MMQMKRMMMMIVPVASSESGTIVVELRARPNWRRRRAAATDPIRAPPARVDITHTQVQCACEWYDLRNTCFIHMRTNRYVQIEEIVLYAHIPLARGHIASGRR